MPAGATDPATQLQGDWILTRIAGAPVPDGIRAVMTITRDSVEISVGCNAISAVPMYRPNGVVFENVATTKMACEPEIQTLEAQVMAALQRIDAFSVGAGDALSFYDGLNTLQVGALRGATAPVDGKVSPDG